jgi:hypothetical protein
MTPIADMEEEEDIREEVHETLEVEVPIKDATAVKVEDLTEVEDVEMTIITTI